MKTFVSVLALIIVFCTVSVFAHHPAADIVDSDIYAIIDAMVSDTPHAEMTVDDFGGGMEMDITTRSVTPLERMIDDGLLTYAAMLDGETTVTIFFNDDGTVTTTILQEN